MRKLFTLILILNSISFFSQTRNEFDHSPISGDVFSFYQCDSAGINFGLPGNGMFWNYSSIVTHSSLVTTQTATNNANISYPIPGIRLNQGGWEVSYLQSLPSNLRYFGGNSTVGNFSLTTEYSNGILKATYPLSFNTTSTSVSSGTCSISTPTLSSLNGLFTQNTFFVADGTGTIALPNGTLTNVLRVTSTESMVINANPYTFNYIKLSYDYYASGIKQAVFSIVSHTITGTYLSQPFSLPNQVYVKRAMTIPSSTLTSIKQENELKLNFSILPNPSNNEVRVAAKNDFFGLIDQMKIYDLSGKLVNEYQFINDNMLLDVSNYNNGVYFVKFYDRNNTIIETQKLIINH